MLILLCGPYKTGKTISAATFPKPMLWEDWDNGFTSVLNVRRPDGKLLIQDHEDITVVPFVKQGATDLLFKTQRKGTVSAQPYTHGSLDLLNKHNSIISSLASKKTYQDKAYKTLVIDSLTMTFRTWKEMIMFMNNQQALEIQDYGTLENVLVGQFFPGLKHLLATGALEHIILIDHTELEKDELTGAITEYPVGPSRNMGRNIGLQVDEIFYQAYEGNAYLWHTKPTGFFKAGSRLDLPDPVKPGTWQRLEEILKERQK